MYPPPNTSRVTFPNSANTNLCEEELFSFWTVYSIRAVSIENCCRLLVAYLLTLAILFRIVRCIFYCMWT